MKAPTLTKVESSRIDALGHGGGHLWIRFKGGQLYSYPDVPESVFHEGVKSDSIGKWFGAKISGKFKFVKHDA